MSSVALAILCLATFGLPLCLIFDSETMPNWFGMPEDADLPSTFSVEYVWAWKQSGPASVSQHR
jgi:hypothetical protein